MRRAPQPSTDRGRDVVVAIDAGHGGEDPGASGRGGAREKDVVLAIARKLAAEVDAQPGMRAVLVRNGDYFVSHRKRMEIAHEARADFFISIHADSYRDSRRERRHGLRALRERARATKRRCCSRSARTPRT